MSPLLLLLLIHSPVALQTQTYPCTRRYHLKNQANLCNTHEFYVHLYDRPLQKVLKQGNFAMPVLKYCVGGRL
jgi:hypothetical protein